MRLTSRLAPVASSFVLMLLAPSLRAGDWYVDQSYGGCATGTGSSSAPFCKIGDALAVAIAGDTIHVAAGSYFENLVLDKDLTLIGTSGRDFTIVDGSNAGSVIATKGAVTIDVTGFTLTHGLALKGAGIFVDVGGAFSLTSCAVDHNYADDNFIHASGIGGGAFVDHATGVFDDTSFSNNKAHAPGGGIYGSKSNLTLTGCTLDGNHVDQYATPGSPDGSALANDGGAVTITRTTMTGNSRYSALYNRGSGTLDVSDCEFHDNVGYGIGMANGTLQMARVAIRNNTLGGLYGATVTGIDCDVSGNGVANSDSQGGIGAVALTLDRSTIRMNRADRFMAPEGFWVDGVGGGVRVWGTGTALLTDCEVTGNVADDFGGGLYAATGGTISLVRCTVGGNQGARSVSGIGGGIWVDGSSSVSVDETIVAGNSSVNPNAPPDCAGTLNSGGYNVIGDTKGCTVVGDPTGNQLNVDPKYVDPVNGDYSLSSVSTAIDAGDPADLPLTADLTGNPRILDGNLDRTMVVDVGAHEFDAVHVALSGTPTPGGTVTVDTSGTSGLAVLLFTASSPGAFLATPFGVGLFDLASPWIVFPNGVVPNSASFTIPTGFPVPTDLVIQELALSSANHAGALSNSVAFTIE